MSGHLIVTYLTEKHSPGRKPDVYVTLPGSFAMHEDCSYILGSLGLHGTSLTPPPTPPSPSHRLPRAHPGVLPGASCRVYHPPASPPPTRAPSARSPAARLPFLAHSYMSGKGDPQYMSSSYVPSQYLVVICTQPLLPVR